jgi:hypothetical protein
MYPYQFFQCINADYSEKDQYNYNFNNFGYNYNNFEHNNNQFLGYYYLNMNNINQNIYP